MANVPADLQWMCIRKTSSFLHRARNIQKSFSREPMNLKGVNSFRYNGLIHKKDLGVQPSEKGKGIDLVFRAKRHHNKPGKNLTTVHLKKDGRRVLSTIKRFMKNGHYRSTHHKLAMRRASQLLRGQRPVSVKKLRGTKKPKAE